MYMGSLTSPGGFFASSSLIRKRATSLIIKVQWLGHKVYKVYNYLGSLPI